MFKRNRGRQVVMVLFLICTLICISIRAPHTSDATCEPYEVLIIPITGDPVPPPESLSDYIDDDSTSDGDIVVDNCVVSQSADISIKPIQLSDESTHEVSSLTHPHNLKYQSDFDNFEEPNSSQLIDNRVIDIENSCLELPSKDFSLSQEEKTTSPIYADEYDYEVWLEEYLQNPESHCGDEAYEEEVSWLAHLISAEGGGEPIRSQMGIGTVVLNRVDHELFPNSLIDVIFQDGQYSCTWEGGIYCDAYDSCWTVARFLLEGNRLYPSNVVYQSGGMQGDGLYEQLGIISFCYIGEYIPID